LSLVSYWLLAWLAVRSLRWRRYIPPKRRTLSELHGVTIQTTSRTGKAMGPVSQCWWMICREIKVFSRFEYHMFYVLYPFVTYLPNLSRISWPLPFTSSVIHHFKVIFKCDVSWPQQLRNKRTQKNLASDWSTSVHLCPLWMWNPDLVPHWNRSNACANQVRHVTQLSWRWYILKVSSSYFVAEKNWWS
jgi:hypothetical protein